MGKPYRELTISDDFMFFKVMTSRPDLCKELLELILKKKIREIKFPEGQKVIDMRADAKSIRLDVYTEDDDDIVYNVEMQASDTGEIPKRSRYYQGMIDLNLIEKGEIYKKLRKSYVIFICKFDLFKQGQYVYTFENMCIEVPGLKLGDETCKVFLNADGTKGDISPDLKAFLELVKGQAPAKTGGLAAEIQEQVEKARANTEWEVDYMTLLMRDKQNWEEGHEKGLAEGHEKGLAEGHEKGLAEGRIKNIAVVLQKPNGEHAVRFYMDATDKEIEEAKKLNQLQCG